MRITATLSGDKLEPQIAHAKCRGALYELIRRADPDMADAMHEKGWNGNGRRPWSVYPPVDSVLNIATPIDELGQLFAAGLRSSDSLAWGEQHLHIDKVTVEESVRPSKSGDVVEMWAVTTPVIVQGPCPKRMMLVPGDIGWEEGLRARFASAAGSIGVPVPDMFIRGVGDRSVTQSAPVKRVGAAWLMVEVNGTPAVLDGLSAMGMGTHTTEGFGFVGVRKQLAPIQSKSDPIG